MQCEFLVDIGVEISVDQLGGFIGAGAGVVFHRRTQPFAVPMRLKPKDRHLEVQWISYSGCKGRVGI
jgi:hypothetical protein